MTKKRENNQEKLELSSVKKTLSLFLLFFKKRAFLLTLVFIFSLLAMGLNLVAPIYYKKLTDLLVVKEFSNIINILLMIFLFKTATFIFQRLEFLAYSYFETYCNKDIEQFCVKKIFHHSFSFFADNFVGSMVRKINKFSNAFITLNDVIWFDLLELLFQIGGICAILYFRSPILAIIVLVWLFIFIILDVVVLKYKLKIDVEVNSKTNKVSGYIADIISNYVNVKLFNQTKTELIKIKNQNEKIRLLSLRSWLFGILFFALQGFLFIILEIALNYFALNLYKQNALTVGDFVMIQSYIVMIMMGVWGIGRSMQRLYEAMAEASEMTEIITRKADVTDMKGAKSLKVSDGEIEFEEVNFAYKENKNLFKKFNLKVKGGEKLALVGPSGSGKSSIIKLLLRMYSLNSGKIFIDGQDISRMTKESLWRNISFVPQEPLLFHRSLYENISYGRKNASRDEVIKAAKKAYAHDFIMKLKKGYDTEVGERGIKLSGGERQRIALARAILKNSPILIMDEATSALDSESEQLIQKALENLMQEKTVIIVAHRLSTISQMDRVIVLQKGKIIEEGSHEELLKNDGLYSKLWNIQAGGFMM
ncbi:MAG: ABC transporter ATP-binding protein [Patescibacteria group bacterium]